MKILKRPRHVLPFQRTSGSRPVSEPDRLGSRASLPGPGLPDASSPTQTVSRRTSDMTTDLPSAWRHSSLQPSPFTRARSSEACPSGTGPPRSYLLISTGRVGATLRLSRSQASPTSIDGSRSSWKAATGAAFGPGPACEEGAGGAGTLPAGGSGAQEASTPASAATRPTAESFISSTARRDVAEHHGASGAGGGGNVARKPAQGLMGQERERQRLLCLRRHAQRGERQHPGRCQPPLERGEEGRVAHASTAHEHRVHSPPLRDEALDPEGHRSGGQLDRRGHDVVVREPHPAAELAQLGGVAVAEVLAPGRARRGQREEGV